jgi:hypothetical protein
VAAAAVDVHAATGRELSGLRVVVRDVPVVRLVILEHDQDVVAPLGYVGDTIENSHDPLNRLVDKRERCFGNVALQVGQKDGRAFYAH